jgi:N-acetylglucosamine repressor
MTHVTSQRDRDKAVILNVLRNFGPISRVEIHRLTHLRHSVISSLTKELISEGKVAEAGASDNRLGRKQTLLRLNTDSGVVLAIEFDAENVVAAVVDLNPRICSLVKEPTDLGNGREGLLHQLLECSQKALSQGNVSDRPLIGIGIADVGLVNRRDGVSVMTSQVEFWRNVPLARIFEEKFGVAVVLENATRCRAIAERLLGSGESADDMVYVEYGAGIGAAMFVGGRLL